MMDEDIKAELDAIFARRNEGWQTIDTAPKDGTVIELTWMEKGNAQEIWPLQWAHIQRNGFFPGKVGMWTSPDGSMTWNDDNPDGAPTHWRSYVGWSEDMRRRYLATKA